MTTLMETYAESVAAGELDPDPVQQAVLPHLDRVRAELSAPQPKSGLFRKAKREPVRGLYLWGGVGRGKSMLMDMAFEAIDVPKERRHFHAFMQSVHSGMTAARARGVDDALKPVADDIAARLRFLAFDEMQITDITDAMLVGRLFGMLFDEMQITDITDAMLVGRLFGMLFDAGVTVITTSNRPPDDLYKDGLNRQLFLPFIELLKHRMEVVELASDTDHRQGKLTGAQTYFTPDTPEARAAVQAIWDRIAGVPGEPLILRVQGRDVEIPRFHNGVARARFYDLCGRPLGAADYLALAEAARVLILEDIPQLSRSNFNEAKRFVTLIDALYEAKVKLICTAAAQPEMLYIEGTGSFEFERTASRMREMQSETWAQS